LQAPYADLCARAQEFLRAGKAGEAAATLSDAVKNGARNADVLSLLGLAHRLLGNASMAASALRAALELMPHNPDIRSNLALMVAASGAPTEARRLWQEVLALRPDHAEARVGVQQLDNPTRHPGEELQLVNAQELGVPKVAATLARCHLILDEIYAHRKSAELGVGVDVLGNPLPMYTYPAIEYLRQFDFSRLCVLEWGSGNSTLWWAKRCRKVVSIEHDSKWLGTLEASLPSNASIRLVTDAADYVSIASDELELFDIIVIDGLYRYDCSIQAVKYLRPGGMIILDNADWHFESSKKLREHDLIQVDFTGFKPAHDDVQTTSVFLHRSFRPQPLYGVQPQSGLGSRVRQAAHDRSVQGPGAGSTSSNPPTAGVQFRAPR
jgi:tetratricopeptide (TPR) repeat protein